MDLVTRIVADALKTETPDLLAHRRRRTARTDHRPHPPGRTRLMNGYFDYDGYDLAEDYDFTPADAPQRKPAAGCDDCLLLPGEAVTVGPLTVVCACWMGRGASVEACRCGPRKGDSPGDGIPD